jgi:hypothetical protein
MKDFVSDICDITVQYLMCSKCFINTHTRTCPLRGCMFCIMYVQTRSLVVIGKVGLVTCPTFFRRNEREKVLDS